MAEKYLIIGGSAGSFQIVLKLLEQLPKDYPYPIFLILHRLKDIRSGFIEALSTKCKMPICEPNDKDIIQKSNIYLAPANYHMYFETDLTISLSTEEPLNHSRPSIDISFMSAAHIFSNKACGILLSGANKDGAFGIKTIKDNGGFTIVQDPREAQIATMPQSALSLFDPHKILNSEEIVNFVVKILPRYD